jgi:hypothetical protein
MRELIYSDKIETMLKSIDVETIALIYQKYMGQIF